MNDSYYPKTEIQDKTQSENVSGANKKMFANSSAPGAPPPAPHLEFTP